MPFATANDEISAQRVAAKLHCRGSNKTAAPKIISRRRRRDRVSFFIPCQPRDLSVSEEPHRTRGRRVCRRGRRLCARPRGTAGTARRIVGGERTCRRPCRPRAFEARVVVMQARMIGHVLEGTADRFERVHWKFFQAAGDAFKASVTKRGISSSYLRSFGLEMRLFAEDRGSNFASPTSVMRPSWISFGNSSLVRLRPVEPVTPRGELLRINFSSSIRLTVLSIQPKHRASSTASS